MSKYYAYIRVSTDKQTLENQKHKIALADLFGQAAGGIRTVLK